MSKVLSYSHVLLPYSRSHNSPQVFPKTALNILTRSAQRKLHLSASNELNLENKVKNHNIWHHSKYPNLVTSWATFRFFNVLTKAQREYFRLLESIFQFPHQGLLLILKHVGTPVCYTSPLEFMAPFHLSNMKNTVDSKCNGRWRPKHVYVFYIVYKHTFTGMFNIFKTMRAHIASLYITQ